MSNTEQAAVNLVRDLLTWLIAIDHDAHKYDGPPLQVVQDVIDRARAFLADFDVEL